MAAIDHALNGPAPWCSIQCVAGADVVLSMYLKREKRERVNSIQCVAGADVVLSVYLKREKRETVNSKRVNSEMILLWSDWSEECLCVFDECVCVVCVNSAIVCGVIGERSECECFPCSTALAR
jgi:hypothetical protein